jgi:hypothetical protein
MSLLQPLYPSTKIQSFFLVVGRQQFSSNPLSCLCKSVEITIFGENGNDNHCIGPFRSLDDPEERIWRPLRKALGVVSVYND